MQAAGQTSLAVDRLDNISITDVQGLIASSVVADSLFFIEEFNQRLRALKKTGDFI